MSDLRTELTDAVSGDAPVSEAELTALLQIAEQLQRIELVSDAEAELATTAMWTRVSAELEPRGERAHRAGLVSAPGQAEPAPQFVAPRVRFRRPLMRIGALGAAALMMSATAVAATDTSAGKTVRKAAHAMRLLPQSAVEHGFVGKNRSSATRDRMRNDAKAARTDIRKAADARRDRKSVV